jgi:hypothetical protein
MTAGSAWEFGYVSYGRGTSYVACDSRHEAEFELSNLDEKYWPAHLVRRIVGEWMAA